jgi:hypothetical protein
MTVGPAALLEDALGQFSWRMAGSAALAGVAIFVIWMSMHQGFFIFLHELSAKRSEFLQSLGTNFVLMQLFVFIFLLCILVAHATVKAGARRFVAYSLATLAAALLCVAIDYGIKLMTGYYDQPDVQSWWKPVDAAWIFLTVIFLGGPCTFAYADFERARESAARLHAAELARTKAARDIVHTRLTALQARVEPGFLFDTLARVKQLYDRDAEKGEATLDALIAYLRTAMPQLRQPGSTLARECEIARTYAEIVAARGDARLRVGVDDGDDSVNEPFPAMLLLPLVERAVSDSRTTPLDDNAIDIVAAVSGARLVVSVKHSGAAFSQEDDATIARVREQLRTLFGDDARLESRSGAGGGSEVTLEVPHEQR